MARATNARRSAVGMMQETSSVCAASAIANHSLNVN